MVIICIFHTQTIVTWAQHNVLQSQRTTCKHATEKLLSKRTCDCLLFHIYIYMHYANLTLSNVKYKYLYLIELRKLVVIHSNGMRQDLKVVGTLSVKFFRDRTWSSFVPIVSNYYYYYYYYCDLTRVIHEKESRGRRSLIIIGSLKNLIFASLSSVYSINFAWSKLSLVGRL